MIAKVIGVIIITIGLAAAGLGGFAVPFFLIGLVVVAGVDAIADALQAVKDHRLDATVFQDARGQGSMSVKTAVKIVKKENYDREVFIPFKLVTDENVAQFLHP